MAQFPSDLQPSSTLEEGVLGAQDMQGDFGGNASLAVPEDVLFDLHASIVGDGVPGFHASLHHNVPISLDGEPAADASQNHDISFIPYVSGLEIDVSPHQI